MFQKKAIKCEVCGHAKHVHVGKPLSKCMQAEYVPNSYRDGLVGCTCPEMVYRLYERYTVKLDWIVDRRLREYIGGLGDGGAGVLPSVSSVIKQAVDEFLKIRGY